MSDAIAPPAGAGRIRILPPELAEQIAAGEVVERPGLGGQGAGGERARRRRPQDRGHAGGGRPAAAAGGRRRLRHDPGRGAPGPAPPRHLQAARGRRPVVAGHLRLPGRGAAFDRLGVAAEAADQDAPDSVAGFRLVLEGGREIEARETGMPDGTQIEVQRPVLQHARPAQVPQGRGDRIGQRGRCLCCGWRWPTRACTSGCAATTAWCWICRRCQLLAERVRSALGRRGTGRAARGAGRGERRAGAGLRGRARGGRQHPPQHLPLRQPALGARPLAAARRWAWPTASCSSGGAIRWGRCSWRSPGRRWTSTCTPRSWRSGSPAPRRCTPPSATSSGAAIARAPWLAPARGVYGAPVRRRATAARDRALERRPRPPDLVGERGRRARRGRHASARFEPAARHRVAAAPGRDGPRRRRRRPDQAPGRGGSRQAGFFGDLSYIGQLHRTYLVCEAPGELVLVDQHAAHERLTFQRLRRAYRAGQVAQQRLLFPVQVELDEAALASIDSEAGAEPAGRPGLRGRGLGRAASSSCGPCPSCSRTPTPEPLLLDALHGLGEGPHLERGRGGARPPVRHPGLPRRRGGPAT